MPSCSIGLSSMWLLFVLFDIIKTPLKHQPCKSHCLLEGATEHSELTNLSHFDENRGRELREEEVVCLLLSLLVSPGCYLEVGV